MIELPATVSRKILEGRVAIVVDGTPFVLTTPMLFVESFQTAKDYYNRALYARLVRIIRYIAFYPHRVCARDLCCTELFPPRADLALVTKPNHPWTNGQVERMNRTIKDATVNRYYYATGKELQKHLNVFVAAYNFAKRLKTLRGLTLYEFIVKSWSENPDLFHFVPSHLNLGLYI